MRRIGKYFAILFTLMVVFTCINQISSSAEKFVQVDKESYYEQYVSIINEVNAKYSDDLEIAPLQEFKETEWIEPKKFRQIAVDMANLKFAPAKVDGLSISPFSTTTKTKGVSTTLAGVSTKINITGSFNTQLVNGRQIFSGINSLTSKATTGTWSQTAYTPSLIDGGRTYAIYVGGKFTYNGISQSTNVYVEFYCSSTGVVI